MQMVEKTELTEQLLMKGYLTRRYQGGEPMITSNLRTTLWSVEKQRRKKKKARANESKSYHKSR